MFKLNSNIKDSLTGKFLIANPYCTFGDIFEKSIIYVIGHSEQGAAGLIINKYLNHLDAKSFFKISDNHIDEKSVSVMLGGPNQPDKSFIIHSADYMNNILFEMENGIAVSSNKKIISDIISNKGPEEYVLFIGYTGWGPGQIEDEIINNYWVIDSVDREMIFSELHSKKWKKSLEKLGICPQNFASQIGMC